MKNLGVGFSDLVASRRKYSLDLDHKEKVRNQDLKNILTDKLQTWLMQPNQMTNRQVALGLMPTEKTPEDKKKGNKR